VKRLERPTSLALCTAALLLAGCASAPPPLLLTLPPVDAASAAKASPPPLATAPLLAVRRLEIPEYLRARRVRYRADDSTLAEWPGAYWAERIEVGTARAFDDALRRSLPGWEICAVACSERSPSLSLQVQVTRMDYLRGERKLQAGVRILLWSTADRPPRLLHSETRDHSIEGDADTPQAQARAVSAFLGRVAADAAQAVAASCSGRDGLRCPTDPPAQAAQPVSTEAGRAKSPLPSTTGLDGALR
jgi:uncharacterized lipoprotein YmbA